MGLEERRLIKRLQDEILPKYQTELQEIATLPVTYDIDWESFSLSRDALSYLENRALEPTIEAFRDICRDDLGIEAVRQNIKSIRIHNNTQSGETASITCTDGVAEIRCAFGGSEYFPAEMISDRLGELI